MNTSVFDRFTARLREFIRLTMDGCSGVTRPGSRFNENEAPGSLEQEFGRLALELFGLQFAYSEPYRRFCAARRVTPATAEHWSQIPAIPTGAFKEFDLSCLDPGARTKVFHSSGTTEQRPSRHFHHAQSLAVYETSLWAWFRGVAGIPVWTARTNPSPQPSPLPKGRGRTTARLARDQRESDGGGCLGRSNERLNGREFAAPEDGHTPPAMLALTPTPAEAPHSSLVHMFDTIRRAFGADLSAFVGRADAAGGWTLDWEAALAVLQQVAAAWRPVIVLGTAFSYVHLLDYLESKRMRSELPPGSMALETGGYKGRSRVMSQAELHALMSDRLGLPERQILCEYGMSELSSQAYAQPERGPDGAMPPGRRCFRFPPWARVQIISPETGRVVEDGETGLIRVFDLANVYSVMAVQTEDLGIRRGDRFELVGRAALAEPRGCSLLAV